MNAKKWFRIMLIMLMGLLTATIAVTVYVDPYFHYHAPNPGINYRLYEERYINDGIGRNFSYNAIITGTSMVQNFNQATLGHADGGDGVRRGVAGHDPCPL